MAKGAKTGGRRPGSVNKVTKDVRTAALKHAPAALKRLAHLAENADSEQAQVAACKEILDRAYGKSSQPLEGELNINVISQQLRQVFRETDGKRLGQVIKKANGAAEGPRVAPRQPVFSD